MPLRRLCLQEGVDLLLARNGALGAEPGDGKRRRSVGEAHRLMEVSASQLRRQQGAVEGISGGRGVHRLDSKAWNERLLSAVAAINALRAQGAHHLPNAHLVEAGGRLCRTRLVTHLDPGQQLGFGLVGGDEIHQRQQLGR